MNTRRPVAHLIFTTHWDREWVQTFEQYRFRLVNLIDKLLDILEAEPSLIFTFDGQVIMVEDYLEVRPDQQPRLQKLARAGRLVLGPWYVLGDQFLEGDEATVRNLLYGFAFCQAYGAPMLEGYVPDSFGSISSLPLILNGFGIRYANFGRGAAGFPADKSNVCRWQSAEGSEVLAFNHGYGNAIGLTFPDIWRDINRCTPDAKTVMAHAAQLLRDEGARGHRPLYLNAGIDHMEMRPGMSKWIEELNRATEAEWISSSPFAFAQALEIDLKERGVEPPALCGEMRGSPESPMTLQGVLSTNREVKRLNRLCEILLARVLEPLNVVQSVSTGVDYHASLTHAWKMVLQNHPHDSICACSIDPVVRDVLARFHRVLELYAIVHERMLRNLLGVSYDEGETAPPTQIAVFNSVPHRGLSSFDLVIRVPRRLEERRFSLKDSQGDVMGSAEVLGYRNCDLETVYAANANLLQLECKSPAEGRLGSDIITLLKVKGAVHFGSDVGWSVFALGAFEQKDSPCELSQGPNWIGNSRLKVVANEKGEIQLIDEESEYDLENLFWFEDSADLGDSYDYQPLKDDVELIGVADRPSLTSIALDGAEAVLTLTVRLDIPFKSKASGRDLRSEPHDIELSLTLRPNEKVLYAKIKFTNRSINHRLRIGFRFAEEPKLYSGGHFTAIERNFGRREDQFPCRPLTDYLHLGFAGNGLAILTKGLYEFEPRRTAQGTDIYITLCRSTETLGPAAGSNYAVEHAKELGAHEIELALVPSGSLPETIRHSLAYTVPLVGEALLSKEAKVGSFLTLDNPDVILSALKRSEDQKGYIVRLFNPEPVEQPATLELHFPFRNVERVELSEEISARAGFPISASKVSVTLAAHEVVTLKVWTT